MTDPAIDAAQRAWGAQFSLGPSWDSVVRLEGGPEAVDHWTALLQAQVTCRCGHRHTGQLSDNFRAIRL